MNTMSIDYGKYRLSIKTDELKVVSLQAARNSYRKYVYEEILIVTFAIECHDLQSRRRKVFKLWLSKTLP